MGNALCAIKALVILLGIIGFLAVSPILVPWYCIYAFLKFKRRVEQEMLHETHV